MAPLSWVEPNQFWVNTMFIQQRVQVIALAIAFVGIHLAASSSALAYTPDDPNVRRMVDRGTQYLASASKESYRFSPGSFNGYLGEKILAAYTYLKATGDSSADVVSRGLGAAKILVRNIKDGDKGGGVSKEVYESAVGVMFLAELGSEQYQDELKTLADFVYDVQYSNGGFGYVGEKTTDISQTQYGVLAIWTLDHVGIPMEYERVKKCGEAILRTQSTNGGWNYQARDPGRGPRVTQSGVNRGMSLAGASSLLIASDALRLWGDKTKKVENQWDGMPDAVKVYVPDSNAKRRQSATLPREVVVRSISNCDEYLKSAKSDHGHHYPYYEYYTLERYESFKEIALGGETKSPAWYTSGVDELRSEQSDEGAWGLTKRSDNGSICATSFAILFLIRSTKKSIAATSSGTLAGGWKLPSDTTKIRVDGTQIKGEPVATAVTDLLDILEEDGGGDLEGKSLPENMVLPTNPRQRAAQIERLQRLLRGSQQWQARRVAARVLGQSDEMRVVPTLIYALSDPDSQVKLFARDGLRFISRKFEGFGMPSKPSYADLRKAQNAWREWYLTMEPGHVFLE
ncbi:MAG: hypothetical protein AAF539_01930 [Planctomycetota bacterium]